MSAKRAGLLAFKILVTVGLLWLLAGKIDLQALGEELSSVQPLWMGLALTLLLAQLVLAGIRWYFVGRIVSASLEPGQAVRLAVIGQFFSQVLPTSIGGDAVRAWLLSRDTARVGRAVASIVCDRIAAMVVMVGIIAVSIPLLPRLGLQSSWIESLAIAAPTTAALGAIAFYFLAGRISALLLRYRFLRPLGVLTGDLRAVLFGSANSAVVLALALAVQTLLVLAVMASAKSIGAEFGAVHALLVPAILLISMFPISFAGWGVREGAMVVGLGLAGISAHQALAISVLHGLGQLVIGLPGGILWLLYRRRAA